MAMRIKEQDVLTEVGNSYIKQLKNVYSTANLQFISSITRTSKDDGFNLFLINRVKVDSVLGGISAENKIRGIIKRENIDFYLSNTENQPDWDQISTFLKSRYGVIGEEKAYGEAMIYFLEKRNWKQFGKYYALYYNTAISRSEYDINNVTWLLFENVNDRDVLEVAKKTMKYNIENELNDSHVFDTYANLLYKLGKYDEALHWERKAVQLAPNSEDIAENFRKMKDRIPTWN
jgi:tetratricopeptide (TPR) repeat protein